MGVYLKVTDRAMLDAISNMRGSGSVGDGKTLLSMCPEAHSIHYHAGEPIGLLIDQNEIANRGSLTAKAMNTGLKQTDSDIMRFGKSYGLYEPNLRSPRGREFADALDVLRHTTHVAQYALELIAPRIRAKLTIEEFGFDYKTNARITFTPSAIFVGMVGVTIAVRGYDTGSGVELITRDEYRAAVMQQQVAVPDLLFNEQDSLVIRTQAALDPFMPLPMHTVNRLMTDIYQRVITEPKDIGYYIPHVLLDRELVYLFTTIVAILHAFYGIE